jgi:4'-phosphopantetheinyl transferase
VTTASGDTVEIWYLAIESASISRWERSVSRAERAQAASFRRPVDAARFLASRALTRAVLAARLGIAPRAVEVSRVCEHCGDVEHGRPRVGLAQDEIGFSATRTGPLVAIAVATGPVGFDAECQRGGLDELVASQAFSDADRALLRAGTSPVSDIGVLKLWVAKEAVGKASGLGLVHADRIETAPATCGLWASATDALGGHWSLTGVRLPGIAAAAVAVRARPSQVVVHDAVTLGL